MGYELGQRQVSAQRRPVRGARRSAPRQLGDVEGFFDFFSSNLSAPGDDAIKAWVAQVRARGNRETRMPSGAQVGKLAERHDDTTKGTYTITLAPANVLAAEAQNVAAGKSAVATDAFFDSVQPGALIKDLGKAAGAGVSAITGIPTWAIPVLLIGGGAFLLVSAAHSFLPDRRAH